MSNERNKYAPPDIVRYPKICSHCGREFDVTTPCPKVNNAPVCYYCCRKCEYSKHVSGYSQCKLKLDAKLAHQQQKKAKRGKR